ncbi:MAG TPA: tetratricopeptide repeat protein [Pyrinomonadaceae bacterium]|nr:tetratricopeptide repeat protein [Pyrinomonadaceae bacterium]
MKLRITSALAAFAFVISLSLSSYAQGDVWSATGMPIPIGQPVIWGKIELRGLKPDQRPPIVVVRLMFNGAQIGRAETNDRGFYYFLGRPRDGSELQVSVGGADVGRVVLTAMSGERHDMAVDWNESFGHTQQTGVISVRDAYTGRSASNAKLFDSAAAAVKGKKTDEAIKIYEQIVAADPKDFVAWTELGSLQFQKNKHAEAESSYGRALELKADFMPALMNLGKLHMSRNKHPEAILVLEKAVMADPASADAFHYLGESYLNNKQGSKAVGVLNEAIRLAPIEKAEIHLRLAALYNAAGAKDRAVAEYKMFLEKVPNHAEKSKMEKYIKDNS